MKSKYPDTLEEEMASRFLIKARREKAKRLHDYKFWPHVGRVDKVFGDRNPVCSCMGMEKYQS